MAASSNNETMVRTLSTLLLALCFLTTRAVTVSISVNSNAYCVYATGSLCAEANGGVGPYTYLWSTGSTSTCIFQLTAGTYSVTVTDGLGAVATDEVTVQSEPMPGTSAIWLPRCPIEWEGVWPQYNLIGIASIFSTGVEPFTTDDGPIYYLPIDEFGGYIMLPYPGVSGEPLEFTITDGNGCTSNISTVVPQPPTYLQPQILDVEGACSGGANGRVRVFVPAEPNGWSSAFKLFGPNGYLPWTSSSTYAGPNGFGAGDAPREFVRQNLSPGTYHLVQHTNWDLYPVLDLEEQWFDLIADECPDTLATFEVPDLGFVCGTLTGKVYIDVNENCFQNGTDLNLPGTVIEVQPGNYYTLTDGLGRYSINLPNGTYTVADQNPLYQEHCGVEGTPFTIGAGIVTRDLADTSLTGLDVRVSISSGAARPGFEVNQAIRVQNLTGVNGGNGTVSYTYDPTLTYLVSNPAPTSIVGNTLTWSLSNLGAFGDRYFRPRFQVPPDINLLGVDLLSSGSVTMLNNENNTENNTAAHVVTITGAYDPNDKLARTSGGNTSMWQLGEDQWIDYTIRFQNTGTDTAFFVVITDTLPANLDPATFEAGASSHTHSVSMRGNGILRWMFPNILLPDSNVNEPLSHGFVGFRIRPHLPVLPGDEIENIANIYFDFNPPIITEPSVLVAEFSTGVGEVSTPRMTIQPNPAMDRLHVVSHAATSGSYRVFSADGREVRPPGIWHGHRLELDVRSLRSGLYMLQLDGSVERFIKQ